MTLPLFSHTTPLPPPLKLTGISNLIHWKHLEYFLVHSKYSINVNVMINLFIQICLAVFTCCSFLECSFLPFLTYLFIIHTWNLSCTLKPWECLIWSSMSLKTKKRRELRQSMEKSHHLRFWVRKRSHLKSLKWSTWETGGISKDNGIM